MEQIIARNINGMNSIENTVADIVIAKFEALPSKSKPVVDVNGVPEWVPLSGIVISNGTASREHSVLLQLIPGAR